MLKTREDPRAGTGRLLQGIATGDTGLVRDAWRDLIDMGPAAAPMIQSKLASSVWSERAQGASSRYLGALLSLLHEIDTDAFRAEITRLQASKLSARHRHVVDFLGKTSDGAPAARLSNGTPIYIADAIEDRDRLVLDITTWSKTPGVDLSGISRIDIIPRERDMDYHALYRIWQSGIVLTFPRRRVRRPALWWQRAWMEFTFYHEIGHHCAGHLEGGLVDDQEVEADAFAGKALQAAHPVFFAFVRGVVYPLRRPMAALERRLTPRLQGCPD